MPDPKPTRSDIDGLYEDYRSRWSGWRREAVEDAAHVAATDKWGVPLLAKRLRALPDWYQPTIVPYMRWAVSNFRSAILNGEEPVVTAVLAGSTTNKQKELDRKKLQKAGQAAMRKIWTHGATESPLLDFGWQLASLGIGVLVYDYDKSKYPDKPGVGRSKDSEEEWERYEAACRQCWPVNVRSVSPHNVYFDLDNDPPRHVFIVEKVSKAEMVERYPKLADASMARSRDAAGRYSSSKDVERIQYWCKDWCFESVGGVPTLADGDGVVPNKWGLIPVQIATASMGYQDADYTPAARYQGIVRAARAVVLDAIAEYNYYQIMRVVRAAGGVNFQEVQGAAPGAAKKTAAEYGQALFARNVIETGVTVTAAPVADLPAFLATLTDLTQRNLEVALGSPNQSGTFDSDNATVNTQNLSQTLQRYKPAAASAQQAQGQMLLDLMTMYKLDADDDSVFSLRTSDGYLDIAKDDIPLSGLSFDVDSTPPTLAERQQNLAHDAQLLEMRIKSPEQVALSQGNDEYDKTVKDWALHDLRLGVSQNQVHQTLYNEALAMEFERLKAEQREKDIKGGVIPQADQQLKPPTPEPDPMLVGAGAGGVNGQQGYALQTPAGF